jgi:hypothetical protein
MLEKFTFNEIEKDYFDRDGVGVSITSDSSSESSRLSVNNNKKSVNKPDWINYMCSFLFPQFCLNLLQNADIDLSHFEKRLYMQWFSLVTPVSTTNKTDRHDIT